MLLSQIVDKIAQRKIIHFIDFTDKVLDKFLEFTHS
jgi:hypothetical protein